MGCFSSKHRDEDAELQPRPQPQITISAPTGGPVLVPPPYRDESGRPISHTPSDLDAETLNAALGDMAQFLDQQGVRAQLVTVGGAVNTLFLKSRQSTHDVDFFLQNSTSSVHHAINEAARFANKQRGGRLGAEWLNNATQLFMSAALQRELYDGAVRQNAVVFQSSGSQGGLIVYAAPWSYAFCGKLNRLCEKDRRPYDLADSVVYLRRYMEQGRRQTLGVSEIRQWCEQFVKKVTDDVLAEVDEAYSRKYGHRVMDWQA